MIYKHTNQGAGNFEPLPVGKYAAVISKVEEKEGPKSKYLAITFDIQEPDYESRKVWYNAPFNTSFLDALLIALGYEMEEGKEIEFDTDDSEWTNPVTLAIGHKMYNGKPQEVVQSISGTNEQGSEDEDVKSEPASKENGKKNGTKNSKKKKSEIPF